MFLMYFYKFLRDFVLKFLCNLENEVEEEMNFYMIFWVVCRGCGVVKERRRWGVVEEGLYIKGEWGVEERYLRMMFFGENSV